MATEKYEPHLMCDPPRDLDTGKMQDLLLDTSSSSLSALERLPVELLQVIAWHAQNPLVYLTSKTIASRLPTLADYEFDLTLLMWCDRHQTETVGSNEIIPRGWTLVESGNFPWRTPTARSLDWKPDYPRRLEIQKNVFELAWLTERKFRSLARRLLNTWVACRWNHDEDWAPETRENFSRQCSGENNEDDFLLRPHISGSQQNKSFHFSEGHTKRRGESSFQIWPACQVVVTMESARAKQLQRDGVTHALMDTLYLPSWLLKDTKEHSSSSSSSRISQDDLFPLLRHSRALTPRREEKVDGTTDNHHHHHQHNNNNNNTTRLTSNSNDKPLHFDQEQALQSLHTAIRQPDKITFIRLFSLFTARLSAQQIRTHFSRVVVEEMLIKLPFDTGERIAWHFEQPWSVDRLRVQDFHAPRHRADWMAVGRLFDAAVKDVDGFLRGCRAVLDLN